MSDEPKAGVKRREFLKVVGATTAAATAMVGCSSEKVEQLIPYLVSPDETVPGVSTYYATTCRECSVACGVIAETRDGRAIKLEGNPAHPLNRGALCARGQAALQGLYNPDRYRGPMIRKNGRLEAATWDEALAVFRQKLAEARGAAANAVFINRHESGNFPAFLNGWLSGMGMPSAISYDPDADFAAITANKQSYGVAWPRLDFSSARLIVSFGADFLDGWGASVPQQLDFADARARLEGAPRFVYIGARRTLTGLNADQWINARPGSELAILQMLGGTVTPQQAAQQSDVNVAVLTSLQREFAAARPNMVIAGGSSMRGVDLCLAANALNQAQGSVGVTVQPARAVNSFEGIDSPSQLRAVAQRMQAGAVSLLMVRGANPAYTMPKSSGFAAAMAKVPFKISFASIPDETSAMADLVLPDNHSLESWGDAEPVRGTLSLQQPTMDPVFNTRATADVLLSVGRSPVAAPAAPAAGAGATPVPPIQSAATATYRTLFTSRFPGGATALAAALPRGIAAGSAIAFATPRAVPAPVVAAAAAARNDDLFLMVYPSPVLGMGDGANKPWLQELPDPVTKIAWQTVAEIHPATAERLGVGNGDHVTVQTSAGSLTIPAYTYLGIRKDTVAIAAGRGHSNVAGRYARAGHNAFDLLPYSEDRSGAVAYGIARARVSKAGGFSRLATTEGSSRQHGRGIGQAVMVADLGRGAPSTASGAEHAAEVAPGGSKTAPQESRAAGEHGADKTGGGQAAPTAHSEFPGDASHEFLPGLRSPTADDAQGDLGGRNEESKEKGMYDPKHWSGLAKHRWAMTIDLARCTGCSACVTACYAANNIPTVGADWQGPKVLPDRTGFGANITRSREMAWLRLERYFEGGEDGGADFDTRFVPMLCQHCGNAPCEPVCPVYATYHSPDGLNVQVYNRCVGTRYCSNNCPYKVRYFNWFGYGEENRSQYAFPEPLHWQLNPDVTVRAKGVMEKCTFCVQRIRDAENRAALEHRGLIADEFTTACAEACPSRAITFGDAADERWAVAQRVKDERAYHVFEELNTYTAV
ncbi:MAG TPA: molybdopterin-dependent oxidoreductase, partial [Gemmatimonadaceae bacterium]|nr:molybdopterin-dependent oxidoreductase [Gemmatimonadaceae bacterium]